MGTFSKTFLSDDESGAIVAVDTNVYGVHNGHIYNVSEYTATVVLSDMLQYYIDTGAKECHLRYSVAGNKETLIQFHASIAITATNMGSALTSYNNNRGLAADNTASTVVYASGTVTTSGAIVETLFIPGTGGGFVTAGGEARPDAEWQLDANSQYMIRMFPPGATASTSICINIMLHEH